MHRLHIIKQLRIDIVATQVIPPLMIELSFSINALQVMLAYKSRPRYGKPIPICHKLALNIIEIIIYEVPKVLVADVHLLYLVFDDELHACYLIAICSSSEVATGLTPVKSLVEGNEEVLSDIIKSWRLLEDHILLFYEQDLNVEGFALQSGLILVWLPSDLVFKHIEPEYLLVKDTHRIILEHVSLTIYIDTLVDVRRGTQLKVLEIVGFESSFFVLAEVLDEFFAGESQVCKLFDLVV